MRIISSDVDHRAGVLTATNIEERRNEQEVLAKSVTSERLICAYCPGVVTNSTATSVPVRFAVD